MQTLMVLLLASSVGQYTVEVAPPEMNRSVHPGMGGYTVEVAPGGPTREEVLGRLAEDTERTARLVAAVAEARRQAAAAEVRARLAEERARRRPAEARVTTTAARSYPETDQTTPIVPAPTPQYQYVTAPTYAYTYTYPMAPVYSGVSQGYYGTAPAGVVCGPSGCFQVGGVGGRGLFGWPR